MGSVNVSEAVSQCRKMPPEEAWTALIDLWKRKDVGREWDAVIRSSVVYELNLMSRRIVDGSKRLSLILDDLQHRVTRNKEDDDVFWDFMALADGMSSRSRILDAIRQAATGKDGTSKAARLTAMAEATGRLDDRGELIPRKNSRKEVSD